MVSKNKPWIVISKINVKCNQWLINIKHHKNNQNNKFHKIYKREQREITTAVVVI